MARALNLFHAWMDGNLSIMHLQAMADLAADQGDIEEVRACEDALSTIKKYRAGM